MPNATTFLSKIFLPGIVSSWNIINNSFCLFSQSATSGIFYEVQKLEDIGRIKLPTKAETDRSIDTLVRRGDHVYIDVELAVNNMMAFDFTRTGCTDTFVYLNLTEKVLGINYEK